MAISFDGASKLATLSLGTTTLSVPDLWSRAVDWWLSSDNSKWTFPFEQVGGNDIDEFAGTAIPLYIYALNGWRVRPQEAHHTLNVTDGVLLVQGGGDPFVNTVGAFQVRVNYQQPVQGIGFATGGGGGASAPSIAAAVWAHTKGAVLSALAENKCKLDRATGILTVYADDGVTELRRLQLYSADNFTVPYDGTAAMHSREVAP